MNFVDKDGYRVSLKAFDGRRVAVETSSIDLEGRCEVWYDDDEGCYMIEISDCGFYRYREDEIVSIRVID